MSVLVKINSKMKDNFLSLHPIWHFASRMQFSFILPVRNVCVDKMDYWFRECAVTGVTVVTNYWFRECAVTGVTVVTI